MSLEDRGWFVLNRRMRSDRLAKLRAYATEYFEPVLEKFPELSGKVALTIRKHGWFAEYKPVLHIIVREIDLEQSSPWRIRSLTAHELMHLLQYLEGIGIGERWNKTTERQATFRTFARGFAYDFLKAFPAECQKEACDHSFTFGYFRCRDIFDGCCRDLDDDQMRGLAKQLEDLALAHDSWEQYDFVNLVHQRLLGG